MQSTISDMPTLPEARVLLSFFFFNFLFLALFRLDIHSHLHAPNTLTVIVVHVLVDLLMNCALFGAPSLLRNTLAVNKHRRIV